MVPLGRVAPRGPLNWLLRGLGRAGAGQGSQQVLQGACPATCCAARQSVGRLVSWSVGQLGGQLVGWLVAWLVLAGAGQLEHQLVVKRFS